MANELNAEFNRRLISKQIQSEVEFLSALRDKNARKRPPGLAPHRGTPNDPLRFSRERNSCKPWPVKTLQSLVLAISVLLASGTFIGIGCSAQSEGARCNADNADLDCADGLICKRAAELGGNADICCPADDAAISSNECVFQGGTSGGGGSGGTSSDGGSAGDGGTGGDGGTSGDGGNGGTGGTSGPGGAGGGGGAGGA